VDLARDATRNGGPGSISNAKHQVESAAFELWTQSAASVPPEGNQAELRD